VWNSTLSQVCIGLKSNERVTVDFRQIGGKVQCRLCRRFVGDTSPFCRLSTLSQCVPGLRAPQVSVVVTETGQVRRCVRAGATVCHVLARYGHTRALSWLVETTGDECLAARTLRGATPLHYAATTGHLDTLCRIHYSHTHL